MSPIKNPNKFTDKYRVNSSRLKNWDYSTPGYYFITICTYNHNNFFGKIINNKMELSKKGEIVRKYLIEIPKHFKNILIDEYITMPNHVHILIKIIKPNYQSRDAINRVSTKQQEIKLDNKLNIFPNPMINFSLSTVIRWYKAKCTFEIKHQNNLWFAWQPRFHDKIIKNKKELLMIKKYIQNNIINWDKDKFYCRDAINRVSTD